MWLRTVALSCAIGLSAAGAVGADAARDDSATIAVQTLELDTDERRDCALGAHALPHGQPVRALADAAADGGAVPALNDELRSAGYRVATWDADARYSVKGTIDEMCLHEDASTSATSASVLVTWELTDNRSGRSVYAKKTPASAVLYDDEVGGAMEAIRRGFRVFLALPGFRSTAASSSSSVVHSPPILPATPSLGSLARPDTDRRSFRGRFAGREEFRPSRWSRSLFWAGAAADLYTTSRVLDTDGLDEANPIFSGIGSDDSTVLISAAAFKTGAYFLIRRGVRRGWLSRKRADLALGVIGGAQLGAAVHNHRRVQDR